MKKIYISIALCIVTVFSLYTAYTISVDEGFLRIYFLDIGQGDSIYIRAPGGKDMLIDGGPSASVIRRLAEVMPWYDTSIDIVMESHPDADHIGGLPDVLRRYTVGLFVEPGIESKNSIDDALRKLIKEKSIETRIVRRGMNIDMGNSVYFKVLFPDTDVTHFKDTNDASIVGKLVYGSTTIMFTGDSPKKIENHLLSIDKTELKSDVIKVGHHGSKGSSGNAFIEAIDPAYAVISVGTKNRYGHPHPDVLDTFATHNVRVLRTDEEGTIRFKSNGIKIWRE